jgi:hypothetical protein
VAHTQGARSAKCIPQALSCAGGKLPSTSQLSYSERAKSARSGMYLSDTLHQAVAGGCAIRGIDEVLKWHTRYTLKYVPYYT